MLTLMQPMGRNLRPGMRAAGGLSTIFQRAPLDLRFAQQKTLDPRVTFTRASNGTYVGGNGLIKTAATNEPRFDHNPTTGESLGLLVEEARTNNLVQSEDFSTTWTASTVTVTTNTVVAPDGTTTADTFGPVVGDGLTTTRFLRQNPVLTTQQAYTLSVFVKVGTAATNGIALYVSDTAATNSFRANFNLFNLATSAASTGWATPTATIIPYPNGWYRCVLSGVTSTAHASLRAIIYLNTFGSTSDTYGTIHIWGAQLEAGSFPTSYIPTTTAAVTRSADVCSITGSNFSSWYRQDQGTVFADFAGFPIASGQFPRLLECSDGTSNNVIRLQQYSSNTVRVSIIEGGLSQMAQDGGTILQGNRGKTALAVSTNDCAHVVNGGALSTDSSVTIPTGITQATMLCTLGGTNMANSTIRRLTYWPQRLPSSTLQTITQ